MNNGDFMLEINNLLKKIKKENGVSLKIKYDLNGNLSSIYLEKMELYSKISFENIMELYRLCSCFTHYNPNLLINGLHYNDLHTIDYREYKSQNVKITIFDIIKSFLGKKHPPKKGFSWYINILFPNKNDNDILYINSVWDNLQKDEYISKHSIFLNVGDFHKYTTSVKQYVENTYGKDHHFKFLFTNNTVDKNYYDILNKPMEFGIRVEKL